MTGLSEMRRAEIEAGRYQVRSMATVDIHIDELMAEVDRVQRAYTVDTAELKRHVAALEAERDELNAMVRSSNTAAVEARADRSAQYDDLVHALGRDGNALEWSDLVDLATSYMRRAEGLEAGASARVAELERERHETNTVLDEVVQALRAKQGAGIDEAANELERQFIVTGDRLIHRSKLLGLLREWAAARTDGAQ